ncbi:MAG: hypothetical protein HDQ88_04925 [Clostridia bacterium]|nr:hypothetical protein [Clostridia bacterium]
MKNLTLKITIPISIVGRRYEVRDNSWIRNVITNEDAYLFASNSILETYSNYDDGKLTIVSEPYTDAIECPIGEFIKRTFINVHSNKTNNIYRTLYVKDNIL